MICRGKYVNLRFMCELDLTKSEEEWNIDSGVLLQKEIPNEVKVEKCDNAGSSPAQSCEILRVGVSS